MKKAILSVCGLFALTSSLAHAGAGLQVSTVLSVDGQAVQHTTAYIDNGEIIHYQRHQAQEVEISSGGEVKAKKKLHPIGLEADITARMSSEGKVLVSSKGSYVGFYGDEKLSTPGGVRPDFWVRRVDGVQTVELGKPARFQESEGQPGSHTVDLTVTVLQK